MASRTANDYSKVFTIILVAFTVAVLYFAREVLIPLALATLLSFLLGPLVTRLERLGLPRVPAAVAVVLGLMFVVGLFGWLVADQVISLGNNYETYRQRIETKVKQIAPDRKGILGKLQETIEEVQAAVAPHRPPAKPADIVEGATDRKPDEPIPVAVVRETSPLGFLPGLVGSVFGLLASTGVVILLVLFMLIERDDLRNRVIRLIGQRQISVTTQAMHDAAKRVSRYLLMQLLVNSSYGLAVGIGLYSIGLPNAILWGVLAAVLRYIPYLGPWIAASIPLVLSLAVFDGWTEPVLAVALFVVLELISNNLLEPLLYGSSTGISTMGILVAAVFWTWLWGAVGLVMATPLTVCIAVMGRYVPKLEFFNVLLSDEEVLTPAAQYYQRLLAEDEDDATALLSKLLEGHELVDVFDQALLPALELIEHDAHRGDLADSRQAWLHDTIRETVEELAEQAAAQHKTDGTTRAPSPTAVRSVICLPARDAADELAGLMLTRLLELRGMVVHNVSVRALVSEMVEQASDGGATVACVSAVPPFAVSHARYLCKRLRAKSSTLRIVVGLWQTRNVGTKTQEQLRASYADRVVTTLREALEQL